jgi:hypothetical protein
LELEELGCLLLYFEFEGLVLAFKLDAVGSLHQKLLCETLMLLFELLLFEVGELLFGVALLLQQFRLLLTSH